MDIGVVIIINHPPKLQDQMPGDYGGQNIIARQIYELRGRPYSPDELVRPRPRVQHRLTSVALAELHKGVQIPIAPH